MIIDDKMVRATLFDAVEKTMRIIISHLKVAFFNPGKLYGDLTIEQLKTDSYPSRTRNKLIAEAFYLTGDIEKYGSGYQRIRNAIKDYPTMTFEYEESGDGYMVTVDYRQQKQTTELNGGVTEGVKNLLNLIKQNPGLRTTQIEEQLNVPVKTLERWLKQLKNQNKIVFKGAPKTGGYYAKP